MENAGIRQLSRKANVPLWKIAAALGVSEATMTRWMRLPLQPERETQIIEIIHDLQEGGWLM
jgi:hypothetical protein